jgi:hypothetical protein
MKTADSRWIVRYKSRVITGGWEESLFYEEENARGFAQDAGKGVTVRKYVPAEPTVAAPEPAAEDAEPLKLCGDLAAHHQEGQPKVTITEAARKEILETLRDLIERYEYEIIRDALWGLKPDTTGQYYCGDCRKYVDQIDHPCVWQEGQK